MGLFVGDVVGCNGAITYELLMEDVVDNESKSISKGLTTYLNFGLSQW